MKELYVLLMILTGLNAFAQKKIQTHNFKAIKIYSVDLNNDDIPDTIRLSSSLKEKDAFDRITISLTGLKKQTFLAKDAWTIVDTSFLRNNKNEINSKFIFSKRNPMHSVILLFGAQDGGGYRAEFSIINIENNKITMPFDDTGDKNVEIPGKLFDLDNDGRLDFTYTISFQFSEELKTGYLGAYSPTFVYTVADPCELNKPLMKEYNQKNYVFAGYKYSEDIQIFYPHNKSQKPHIWKN